jgi:predicted secreted protein
MAKVKGEDVVLKITDDLYPLVCARSIQFDISRDMIETSVTGSGVTKTFVPGAISWSGTIEGLTFINGGHDYGDIEAIYNLLQQGEQIDIMWYEKDINNQYYNQKLGRCYITSISEVASFDNMVTFNATFTGTGPIIITTGDV